MVRREGLEKRSMAVTVIKARNEATILHRYYLLSTLGPIRTAFKDGVVVISAVIIITSSEWRSDRSILVAF
jgi:hypothetical protein